VPGGVGPMTIAALLKNTFRACAINHYEELEANGNGNY
jgi:methylenetetrahydrofolate dehydrogenase (NADP+)/methenyltetrahydrofolate cyclohydrolase